MKQLKTTLLTLFTFFDVHYAKIKYFPKGTIRIKSRLSSVVYNEVYSGTEPKLQSMRGEQGKMWTIFPMRVGWH